MIEAPPGKLLVDEVIAYNTGRSFTVKKGQYIRVIVRSTVDFVAFNLDNLKERFSQARTKSNQAKLFITIGRCPLLQTQQCYVDRRGGCLARVPRHAEGDVRPQAP